MVHHAKNLVLRYVPDTRPVLLGENMTNLLSREYREVNWKNILETHIANTFHYFENTTQ